MATATDGKTLDVYKFRHTGLVALCDEVTMYKQNGDFDRWRVDVESARYVSENGLHIVRFDIKEDE